MINNSAWISFTRNCLSGDGLSRMSIRANHCRRPRQSVSAPPKQRLEALVAFGATAADAILVHSDSRSFRDQFQLAFFVRQLDKSGVRLVSITQELGDASMNNMIHQIMALPAANAATPSPGVRPKGGSGRSRSAYHGQQNRAAPHSRRLGRRGGNLRAQFCSELARPRGFEPLFSP